MTPFVLAVDASKIMTLRKELGITQGELAERAGIAVRTLKYVEAGRNATPRTVRAIAAALGVNERRLARPRQRLSIVNSRDTFAA